MYRWFETARALAVFALGSACSLIVGLMALRVAGEMAAVAVGCWGLGLAAGYVVGRLHADALLARLL